MLTTPCNYFLIDWWIAAPAKRIKIQRGTGGIGSCIASRHYRPRADFPWIFQSQGGEEGVEEDWRGNVTPQRIYRSRFNWKSSPWKIEISAWVVLFFRRSGKNEGWCCNGKGKEVSFDIIGYFFIFGYLGRISTLLIVSFPLPGFILFSTCWVFETKGNEECLFFFLLNNNNIVYNQILGKLMGRIKKICWSNDRFDWDQKFDLRFCFIIHQALVVINKSVVKFIYYKQSFTNNINIYHFIIQKVSIVINKFNQCLPNNKIICIKSLIYDF